MQLKDNIFIEGFDTFRECVFAQDSYYDRLIYSGLTSEIPEEVAKECAERIHIEYPPSPSNDYCGGFGSGFVDYQNRGEFAGYNGDATYYVTAKKSILSACNSKYCLIYKT